jgi:hypothetical protein
MGGPKLLALALAACAAAAAGPAPAGGQCRLCETPTTTRDAAAEGAEVSLEIETSLNFDRLILFGEGDGAAIIRPDGSRAVEGSVAEVSARAMVGSAVVRGEPNRIVRVELPNRISLYSLSGSQLSIDDVTSDLPALPKLDSAGNLTFRFGGRVRVTGDSDGEYRGELPITVEYP